MAKQLKKRREKKVKKPSKEKNVRTMDSFVKVHSKRNSQIEEEEEDDVFGESSIADTEYTAFLLSKSPETGLFYSQMPKPYVGGIDIGFQKLGFCVYSRETAKPIFIEQTTLLRTVDGRIYTDYKEKYNHELVYNWIADRWERFFSKMALITIEKQMIGSHVQWHMNGKSTGAITQKERACITIETAMKSILWAERARGGPQIYVVRAQDWKKKAGIEVGNHGAVSGSLQLRRLNNKERSDAMFRRWVANGNECALEVVRLAGGKEHLSTDMCDAFFTAHYAFSQFNRILLQTAKTSNHNAHASMKRVTNADRLRPLPKLGI